MTEVVSEALLTPAVWPRTARRADGVLQVGGVDVRDLAGEFGTPLYVYDEEEMRRHFPKLIAKARPARPLYEPVEGERLPTRISFDQSSTDQRTVIDIETEDRLGLLYVISKVLARLGVDISLAKIYTEKGAAIDTFYVRDRDGKPLMSEERQRQIADALRGALVVME